MGLNTPMRVHDLFEAGIQTADVHMAALRAMPAAMRNGARQVIASAKHQLYDIFEDQPPQDAAVYAQKVKDWVFNTIDWSILTYLRIVSDELSRVARSGVEDRFPEDFPIVTVMARQISTHPSRLAGGSYGAVGHNINVFRDSQDVLDVMTSGIDAEITGKESDPDAVNDFITDLASTFSHEYAHFEQFLRDPRSEKVKHKRGDFTYVTIKPEDGSKGGRRGGLARRLRTPTEQLRYMASTGEIDSFASGAAATLIAKIRNEQHDWNWMVERLRTWLAEPSTDLPADVRRYRNVLRDAFSGRFDDIGLDPNQIVKVKQRFEKLVYQKLGDYLKPTAGKASEVDTAKMPASWVKKANASSRGAMFTALASMVAKNLHATRPDADQELIMSGYGSDTQHDAERFLINYYLGGQYRTSEEAMAKVADMFRRLVSREYGKLSTQ